MPDAKPHDADTAMPTHPEEMKTIFDLRIGKSFSLQGSARVTPAGIVTAGITFSLAALAWTLLSPPGRRRIR